MISIKKRERDAVLQSLQAGLVPRMGLHLIQVGRKPEVEATLKDLARIEEGGASFRLVIGRFGSGKSFFINLVRALALQKKLVVVQADMSMERRLYATQGEARALYAELMRNLATKAKPDGGGLRSLCEGWISGIQQEVTISGGGDEQVRKRIMTDLRDLADHVGGFEFAQVIAKYYEGYVSDSDDLQEKALRWLRAEYTTKTEARQDLDVRRIIDDENFFDSLKLMAAFCRKAGYGGLLVNLDELVVLSHRLPSSRSRQTNFEALLTILNDCLQGTSTNIGFILAGTDEFLEDKRRGLYSYEALRSRLQPNSFVGGGVVDFSGPVIKLQNLSIEEFYVLLANIRHVHAMGEVSHYMVPDEALRAVLQRASEALGAEFFKTPRDIIRSFVNLLNVLEQNPGKKWTDFLGSGFIQKSANPQSVEEEIASGVGIPLDEDGDLANFTLQ